MEASILAISTAVPLHVYSQEVIADKIISMLSADHEKSKIIKKLYQNSGIKTRHSVLSDFAKERDEWDFFGTQFPDTVPGTTQRNDIYRIEAPKLALNAAIKALKTWGGDPADITHVISVSCTGMVAPGIEFELMSALKLKPSVQRLGINFMGCFGAFKGLSVAKAFANENPRNRILVVCSELCSLHFQADQTHDNMLANSLFSDGAAAVIVGTDPKSHEKTLWAICNIASLGLEDTSNEMKWHAGDHGFVMKLSHRVPVYIARNIAAFVHSLTDSKFSNDDCEWAIHPGGKSILQAVEKSLQIDQGATRSSWATLENYGNMSSATFLFILDDLLKQKNLKKWTVGLGFGPGLSVEGIVLKRPEAA